MGPDGILSESPESSAPRPILRPGPVRADGVQDAASDCRPGNSGLLPESNTSFPLRASCPFPDGFFDAVFHFGGFNNFSEPKKTLAEMTRIVKKNGCVVFGDEALPPCLDGTEFGEMMVTNNPLFKNKVPLECLPEGARNVTLRWILGGCFYLINFKVGVGPPPMDMDLPHKGWRGGTMRTRYYGRLEGVTPEARKMAIEAAKARGVSVHEWLDTLVRKAAKSNLEPSSEGGAEDLINELAKAWQNFRAIGRTRLGALLRGESDSGTRGRRYLPDIF